MLRVDPDRHQVTGRLELGAPSGGMPVGPWDVRVGPLAVGLAHGDGAVWVAGPSTRGLHAGGILLRVDPASGRVAGWLRDPRWVFQDVLADGLRGAWVATTAPELLHVVAA